MGSSPNPLFDEVSIVACEEEGLHEKFFGEILKNFGCPWQASERRQAFIKQLGENFSHGWSCAEEDITALELSLRELRASRASTKKRLQEMFCKDNPSTAHPRSDREVPVLFAIIWNWDLVGGWDLQDLSRLYCGLTKTEAVILMDRERLPYVEKTIAEMKVFFKNAVDFSTKPLPRPFADRMRKVAYMVGRKFDTFWQNFQTTNNSCKCGTLGQVVAYFKTSINAFCRSKFRSKISL